MKKVFRVAFFGSDFLQNPYSKVEFSSQKPPFLKMIFLIWRQLRVIIFNCCIQIFWFGGELLKGWKGFLLVTKDTERIAMVFCYQDCSDLLWENFVLSIEKKFWNSRLNFLRSLEQFIQTVKGQNNLW